MTRVLPGLSVCGDPTSLVYMQDVSFEEATKLDTLMLQARLPMFTWTPPLSPSQSPSPTSEPTSSDQSLEKCSTPPADLGSGEKVAPIEPTEPTQGLNPS